MNIRELVYFLIQIAVFFAFPTIYNWLVQMVPWLMRYLDPNSVFGLIVGIVTTIVFWILGALKITQLVRKVKVFGVRKW